eukprot:g1053.t1
MSGSAPEGSALPESAHIDNRVSDGVGALMAIASGVSGLAGTCGASSDPTASDASRQKRSSSGLSDSSAVSSSSVDVKRTKLTRRRRKPQQQFSFRYKEHVMVLSGSFSDESRAILKIWWKMYMGRLPKRPSDKLVARQLRKKVEVLTQNDVFALFDEKVRKKTAKDSTQPRPQSRHQAHTSRSSEIMARAEPRAWQEKLEVLRQHDNIETGGVVFSSTPNFALEASEAHHSIAPTGGFPMVLMNREPSAVYSQPTPMAMPSTFLGLSESSKSPALGKAKVLAEGCTPEEPLKVKQYDDRPPARVLPSGEGALRILADCNSGMKVPVITLKETLQHLCHKVWDDAKLETCDASVVCTLLEGQNQHILCGYGRRDIPSRGLFDSVCRHNMPSSVYLVKDTTTDSKSHGSDYVVNGGLKSYAGARSGPLYPVTGETGKFQFDATNIPPGEYRFHGNVSFEVLLEEGMENVQSSAKPAVQVAHKSGVPESNSILRLQAARCFSFLGFYFQCLGKRGAAKDEIATFVSRADLTQMTPEARNDEASLHGNRTIAGSDLNSKMGEKDTDHLIALNNSSEVLSGTESPIFVVDPMAGSLDNAMVWCNNSYEKEFCTNRGCCIPDGNIFEDAIKLLNGATICGPFYLDSGNGAIKRWLATFQLSDPSAAFCLIKVTLRLSPETKISALLKSHLQNVPHFAQFELKLMWAAHQALQSTLSAKMINCTHSMAALASFVKQHFLFVSKIGTRVDDSDTRSQNAEIAKAVESFFDSSWYFVIDITAPWDKSVVFRSRLFGDYFGKSGIPNLNFPVIEFVDMVLQAKSTRMPMTGSNLCVGNAGGELVQFVYTVWSDSPQAPLSVCEERYLVGVTLTAVAGNPSEVRLENRIQQHATRLGIAERR